MSKYTIERDIEIEAPVEVVWRTITEPELIRAWFSDVADVEARPGAVDGHRHGREVRYEVREERLAEAAGALSEVADRWDRRPRAIKRLAEEAHAAERASRGGAGIGPEPRAP